VATARRRSSDRAIPAASTLGPPGCAAIARVVEALDRGADGFVDQIGRIAGLDRRRSGGARLAAGNRDDCDDDGRSDAADQAARDVQVLAHGIIPSLSARRAKVGKPAVTRFPALPDRVLVSALSCRRRR